MQEEQELLEQRSSHLLDEIIISKNFDLKQHMIDIEVGLINQALNKSQGIVATAAKILGVRRTTLIEKMRRYNIVRKSSC